jgi:uncharacterized delta-60 repeat protein
MWFTSKRSSTAPSQRRACQPRLESLEDRCVLSGGTLDPTFGTGGTLTTAVPSSDWSSYAYATATYPKEGTGNDGKVVAAGTAFTYVNRKLVQDMAVVRYNLDGTLDTTFGGTGEVLTSFGPGFNGATDVKVQSDGKVVAAGWAGQSGSNFSLVRYNTDGTLDTSFGTGGEVTRHFSTSLAANVYGGLDLSIDPNTNPLNPYAGKIVVAAQLGADTAVVSTVVLRLNTNGTPDTSFGSNGAGYVSISNLNGGDDASIAVQSDDRIVVAGINSVVPPIGPIGLARFNPDGTPDATFGSGGFVQGGLPHIIEIAQSLTLQPDGKIIVAGSTQQPNGSVQFMVARFNAADGGLDTSFGTGGVAVSTGFNVDQYNHKVDVALEPDGRIVVAGTSAGRSTFALARFLAAGPQVGTFTASPNPVTAGSSVALTASNVVPLNPGTTVTQVAFYRDSNHDGLLDAGDVLLGTVTQSSGGTWSLNFDTTGLAPGTDTLFAQAEDNYGAFSDPLALTLVVQ